MTGDRRPSPPPLEANDQLVTAVITAAWAVALIVVLALELAGQIPGPERWWLWTCVTGLGMGLFGLWYVPRMKRARARDAARREAGRAKAAGSPAGEEAQPPSSGSKSVSSTDTPGRSTRS